MPSGARKAKIGAAGGSGVVRWRTNSAMAAGSSVPQINAWDTHSATISLEYVSSRRRTGNEGAACSGAIVSQQPISQG